MAMNLRPKPLKFIFFEYLLSIGGVLLFSLGVTVSFIWGLYASNMAIPANYTENIILKNEPKIATGKNFEAKLVPETARYLFINPSNQIEATNMTKLEIKEARHHRQVLTSNRRAYMEINRKDGVVIISYFLKPYYRSTLLAKYSPDINSLALILIIILSLSGILLVTVLWARYLTKELRPLIEVSQKIAQQNLNFRVHASKVKEFNNVLMGLDEMRQALRTSLQVQWQQTEGRKRQISALAHDLKTPVAIVSGNAQLLKTTRLTAEQVSYVDFILKNANRISNYTQQLQAVSLEQVSLRKVTCKNIVSKMIGFMQELCMSRGVKLTTKMVIDDSLMILIDQKLLDRVLDNIVSNAVQYASKEAELELDFKTDKDYLSVSVADNGPGFSKSALKHALEQFYQDDHSRQSGNNYGLGLYIIAQIMKQHHGEVLLSNRSNNLGAIVTLKLPIVDAGM